MKIVYRVRALFLHFRNANLFRTGIGFPIILAPLVCCGASYLGGIGVCDGKQTGPPSGLAQLLNVLSEKTVQAHIERNLFRKYQVSKTNCGGLMKLNGHRYSVRQFSVKMNRDEEWAPAIGGSFFLLTKKRSEAVVDSCRAVLRGKPTAIPLLRRVVVQARLWDVFDSLYRDGVNPGHYGGFNVRRWREELECLAAVMRFLAVTYGRLKPYCAGITSLPSIVGKKDAARWAEFYDRKFLFVHDIANGFRRACHVYLFDPDLNFLKIPPRKLIGFLSGRLAWSPGSAAVLEEDAIAITPRLHLVATLVPVLVRSYKTTAATPHRQIGFQVLRLKKTAQNTGSGAFTPLPSSAEGWAGINLPDVPGHRKPAFRCALSVSCLGCHSPYAPKSFDPGPVQRSPANVRFARPGGDFTGRRVAGYKYVSGEFAALRYYWHRRHIPAR